jgi:hypothetical protein
VLPALLVVFATIADSQGNHALARNALLAAVPFAAVAALVAFGSYLDARDDGMAGLQALLSTAILALLVLSCAIRSSALHGVPTLAVSSLVAALALVALKVLLGVAPYARRLTDLWPAKP